MLERQNPPIYLCLCEVELTPDLVFWAQLGDPFLFKNLWELNGNIIKDGF